MNFTILHFDSIGSTNTEALRQARLGADAGLCIVARQQTAGRGRHGRTWISPEDAGLYMSIILRPSLETKFLPLITLMAGVAVHETLSELGLRVDIKWPNDILVNEKKISGILTESAENERGTAVVVGIGINLTSQNFPDEIAAKATSIGAELEQAVAFSDLERLLIRHFGNYYDMLSEPAGPAAVIAEWKHRSTYCCGKSVRVTMASDTVTGITDGLETGGALRVRKDDGSIAIIQAGDVEKLRAAA